MSRTGAAVAWALNVLALGVLLSTCAGLQRDFSAGTRTPSEQADPADLLPGTWQREYTIEGVHVLRTLVLSADGKFRESVHATRPDGAVTDQLHEGTWLYDGRNLKRKYTAVDGEPPSRLNLPFATFEIAFGSRNEFTGVDHIHHNRVLYRRTAP